MSNSTSIQEFLPMWVKPMRLNDNQLRHLAKNLPKISLAKGKLFCQEIRNFSQKNHISFYLCSAYALELYAWENVKSTDLEKHLSKKLKSFLEFKPTVEEPTSHIYKTILLTGRSGEGKSLLTNHLVGEEVAKIGVYSHSETQEANFYTSDKYKFNIIDSEGLDGTWPEESNQKLMEKIRLETMFYLEIDASIDSIIIMWCPLKNGKSILVKTIEALKTSFGPDIIESCIVMIQGNWKPLAEVLDLNLVVPSGIKEIQEKYPGVPIIEYDAKGSVEEQSHLLNEALRKVKPYKAQSFQEHQDVQLLMMAEAFKLRLQEFRYEDQVQQFCEDFQSNMLKSLKERGHFLEKKKKFGEEFLKVLKGFVFDRPSSDERRETFESFMREVNPSSIQKFFSRLVLWPFLL